jgi:hypothetical protein
MRLLGPGMWWRRRAHLWCSLLPVRHWKLVVVMNRYPLRRIMMALTKLLWQLYLLAE